MKLFRFLFVLAFSIEIRAQCTSYHAPINPTGQPVNSHSAVGGNESGAAWYPNGNVWIGCAQNQGYYAFNPDGTLKGSCATGVCSDCNGGDCEGLEVVGDRLYCIGESSGKMASYDLATWKNNNYNTNGLPRLQLWDTSSILGTNNTEGLAAVPYNCTGCEQDVAFIVSKQEASARAFTLSATGGSYTNLNPTNSKFYPPCANYLPCIDWSGLDYDREKKQLYWSSDGGFGGCSSSSKGLCIATLPVCSNDPNKTCFSDSVCSPGTCNATSQVAESDLATPANNDGAYEGMAVCPSCGYVFVAWDTNSFRTYRDSYCALPEAVQNLRRTDK